MKSSKFSFNCAASLRYYSVKSIPKPHLDPQMPNNKLFLNNEWVDSLKKGNYFTPINPSNGKVITEVQASCKEDLDRAVESAKAAFHHDSPWRRMNASMRTKLIIKLADLMERDAAYLASLETLEVGKVYGVTLNSDVMLTQNDIRHYAGWADKMHGRVIPEDGESMAYTRNEPVGVCGLISAWNFSTLMNGNKLAMCLTTGNVAIVKPSQYSTLSVMHLIELIREAGFPPGVVSLLPGPSSVGQDMCDHPEIDLISFTGSTEVGQEVYRSGAANIKRMILELGGKSPVIVFDDIDLDFAVNTAHTGIFHNAGQCCCAASRVYVQENIFEEFVRRSKKLTSQRRIGNPFDLTTQHGPQANEKHLNSILNMIEIGKKEGAHVEVGGKRCDREGFFMEPTIFTQVNDDMVIANEEIFGPVQLISPFKTMDEAIQKANDTKYGLASCIMTKDVDKINTFSQCVKSGNVWVNCYFKINAFTSFGGFKMSGLNREGGYKGLEAFTEEKTIHVRTPIKIS